MDLEYLRKLGLSLSRAAARGDEAAVLKWATRAIALAAPPVTAAEHEELAVAAVPTLPTYDHVLDYDEEHVIFIAADDAALKALGRPYGHLNEERGALPLTTHLAMAEALNLPLHAAEFRAALNPTANQ